MSEAIEITGRLLESDRNLIGDDEFRVMFIVDKACVPLATALFNRRKQLLTVTVKNEQHLPVAIRFRCVIPEGKTHLGGRKTFRVTFDLPATDAAQGAKFFAMPEGLLYALSIAQGDLTGEPLPMPAKKEPKPAYPAKAKGPYAGFAGRLFALGFFSSPGIKALLHNWEKTYSAENEADAVHCAFGVASRAEISPDAWRKALELEFDRSYPIKSVLDIVKAAEDQAAKVVQ